ncbi:tetracycline resistance protein [Paraoerskovia sediminicola]|uniref:Tetracycline resistance protein n=1 Tax=Paraoerskovia sediminicola TaxID=1138587 RepID=A0ABN6XCZ4_9CELL|nr:MFS transporter [Paraoerskovia sediminicola]BDZ41507.1 tetracycline resistance protein [Paraoerskovia sediminicola]
MDATTNEGLPGERAVVRVQRRTVVVLAVSQVLGGIGVATGISVSPLIAAQLSGSDVVAGLAQTSSVVGAALAALPLARLASARGRRPSVAAGYATAAAGAVLAVLSTSVGSWPLLLVSMLLFGAGSATALASRFAATDLATPARRATDLSIVIWATTIGSVLGPNVAPVMNDLGRRLGMATAGGGSSGTAPTAFPYVFAAGAFVAAGLVVAVALRPDPLQVLRAGAPGTGAGPAAPAGAAAGDTGVTGLPGVAAPSDTAAPQGPTLRDELREGWAAVRASPTAQVALGGIVLGHTVMVGLMSMTPVHMGHGGASLQVIGIVISAHIAGMYALSPVIGWLADRWGHAQVLVLGPVLLLVSAVTVAGAPSDDSVRLTVGLVLLGLGWSCGMIAGSALLVDATTGSRTAVQGLSDLLMNAGGAVGGVLAGVVIAVTSYSGLAWGASALVAVYLVLLLRGLARRSRRGVPA